MSRPYLLDRAWLGGDDVARDVLVEIEGGRFTRVEAGVDRPPANTRHLVGLTVPGLANCHSHAFHRALRGRTQRGSGSFWTWRDQMYQLAGRLDPDSCYDLARVTYREMAAAGYTSVGEFHYLHHGPGGIRFADPNAMGLAVVEAARDAGLRIALLDTCYLGGGIGQAPTHEQARFSDGSAEAWASRVERLEYVEDDDVVVGAAVHSVRAVPRDQIAEVASWAAEHEAPLHVHLSEQVAENEACVVAYGMTPTEVLAEAGALGRRTSAVHATHLTDRDIELLGGSGTHVTFCPTTERDLGDGIGPARRLYDAGAPLTLGSDSHAVIDGFEEMRAVEMHERLASRRRGHWPAEELLTAATATGHASLGFPDAGRIEVGARADLVTLDTGSSRTAGTGASVETAVFAASSADVVHVVAGGKVVATADDRHRVGADLAAVITRLWSGR